VSADLHIFPAHPLTEHQRTLAWRLLHALDQQAEVDHTPRGGKALRAALETSIAREELRLGLGGKPPPEAA